MPDEELLRLTPSEETTELTEELRLLLSRTLYRPAPEPHFARTGLCRNRPVRTGHEDGVESPRRWRGDRQLHVVPEI